MRDRRQHAARLTFAGRQLRAGLLISLLVLVTLLLEIGLFTAYRSVHDARSVFASTLNQLQRYQVMNRNALVLQRAAAALDGSAETLSEADIRLGTLRHQMDVLEVDVPSYFPQGANTIRALRRQIDAASRFLARYASAPAAARPALLRELGTRIASVESESKVISDDYAEAAFRMERATVRDQRTLELTLAGASILGFVLLALGGRWTWRSLRRDVADAERRVRQIAGAIDEILFTARLSDQGMVAVYASKPLGGLLGGGDLDAEGGFARLRSLVLPEDRRIVADHEAGLRRGETGTAEYRVAVPSGTRWILERAHPRSADRARRDDGSGTMVVDGVLADVTGRREAQEAVARAYADAKRQSVTDALTGVHNRHFLHERLREMVAAPRNAGDPAVLLVDVDQFKRVNDEYGHVAGDDVLRQVAERIRGVAEASGALVGRWGGEEFVVLLPAIASDGDLRGVATRIVEAVSRDGFLAGEWRLPVTASIGGARLEGDGDAESLVAAADRALYAAKRRGRNAALLVGDVRESDLAAEDSHVIVVARALALSAAISEGLPEEHAWEVASLAAAVAEEMGLPPWLVMRCRLGGWLHDVGKVAIPNVVLGKSGRLTDEEIELVRTHSAIGEQIVLRVPELREAASAVRHHHERIDGAGYPDGLAGEEIPVEARIVAVADVYSTITSDRVYQRRRSPGAALAELRRGAGSHLDTAVVEAFERVLEAGCAPGSLTAPDRIPVADTLPQADVAESPAALDAWPGTAS